MSPMGNLLVVLSRLIYEGGWLFESGTALKRQIEIELSNINDKLRHNLVASMQKRCTTVPEAASKSKK